LNFNYQNAKGNEFHPDTNYYGISFALTPIDKYLNSDSE